MLKEERRILREAALKENVSPEVSEKVFMAFWKYIRDSIESFDLSEIKSEEELNALVPGFFIPHVGKLFCNWEKYCRAVKRIEYLDKKGYGRESKKDSGNKTAVHKGNNDS